MSIAENNQITDLKKLRSLLPNHYTKELQQRIFEKHGKKYHRDYISMVIGQKIGRSNDIIIREAILYAKERKEALTF